MTKRIVFVSVLTLVSSTAWAQTPATALPAGSNTPRKLATRPGHEINISAQHYDYNEPLGDAIDVRMHAPKVGAEYTGTFSLGRTGRWFTQLNARGTGFITNYDGSCRPWLIVPSDTSPNGYRLGVGAASPCSESNDPDWFVEGRALVGRDFAGHRLGVSPFTGLGVRHLSNGTTGNFNFRTDEYLYIPAGLTLHADRIAINVEYDYLIRGWQKSRNSLLRGGTVPATSTAPAFQIGDFTDLSFEQHKGWAFRASAAYRLNNRWSIEPYYTRWRVEDSPVAEGSVAYVVNGVIARQTLGYYEPLNFTNEFGVKLGFHFK